MPTNNHQSPLNTRLPNTKHARNDTWETDKGKQRPPWIISIQISRLIVTLLHSSLYLDHRTTYLSNVEELMGVALFWAATTAASLEAVLPPPKELPNWAATEDATDWVLLPPVPTPLLAPDPELTEMPPLPVTEVATPPTPPEDVPYLHSVPDQVR